MEPHVPHQASWLASMGALDVRQTEDPTPNSASVQRPGGSATLTEETGGLLPS